MKAHRTSGRVNQARTTSTQSDRKRNPGSVGGIMGGRSSPQPNALASLQHVVAASPEAKHLDALQQFATASPRVQRLETLQRMAAQSAQDGGIRLLYPQASRPTIQRAGPLVAGAIWVSKALGATTLDALIDNAIAAVLGLPPLGVAGHLQNFATNLIPGAGEVKKVTKLAKLYKAINKIAATVAVFKGRRLKGADKLLNTISLYYGKFVDAVDRVPPDIKAAKEAFRFLIGYLREAQVAAKSLGRGHKVKNLGKLIKNPKTGKTLSEIDVVTEEAGKLVYTQVKAGSGANLTVKSNKWSNFKNQIEKTVEAARANGAKVRYVVDDISDDAREYLQEKGIIVELTHEFLR